MFVVIVFFRNKQVVFDIVCEYLNIGRKSIDICQLFVFAGIVLVGKPKNFETA